MNQQEYEKELKVLYDKCLDNKAGATAGCIGLALEILKRRRTEGLKHETEETA